MCISTIIFTGDSRSPHRHKETGKLDTAMHGKQEQDFFSAKGKRDVEGADPGLSHPLRERVIPPPSALPAGPSLHAREGVRSQECAEQAAWSSEANDDQI